MVQQGLQDQVLGLGFKLYRYFPLNSSRDFSTLGLRVRVCGFRDQGLEGFRRLGISVWMSAIGKPGNPKP